MDSYDPAESCLAKQIAEVDSQTLKTPSVLRRADTIIDQTLKYVDIKRVGETFAIRVCRD